MDLLFIFKLCILLSHFERVWTKPNGEIDDFINKLLRSDKFDELAEQVAEKAARKIFDLDHIRISHNIKAKQEKPYKTKHKTLRERNKDDSSEENIKEKPIKMVYAEKVIKEIQEPTTKEELKVKQTVSKEIPSSKEQLPLKFKNLSKASRGNGNKHQDIDNDGNVRESRINFETTERFDRKDKQLKSRFEKVNNHEKESQIKGKSYMSSENEKISHEDTNEEKGHNSEGGDKKNESVSEKRNRSGSEERNRSNLTPKTDIENSNISNDSNERNESQNQVLSLERDNGTLNKEKQISKENAVQKIGNRAKDTSEVEKERDSSEESVEDVRKSFSMTTRKLIIRREGDKLIAFENQSDYKEYEEKVANQKIEKKDIIL
ncbi:uncharacterized protein LOC115447689 [Manduca sexta]|uniref:uncharacterized protein LOC115447689 n=1 Tax=Manduca sexta TaxID=7130 RepID=UPI00188F87FF|nr:uncharacterized protein LOC115447689 [Manduca sexta]